MRKIKFRGKRKDNGEWVNGYYVFSKKSSGIGNQTLTEYDSDRHLIVLPNNKYFEVIPETVGQLVFKKGETEFYEGDIIKQEFFGDKFVGILNYDPIQAQYCLWDSDGFWALIYETIKLLGNKYDNPELLKEIFNEMENED